MTGARLRVLFLGHVARPSGGEIALARLLPALAEHVDPIVVLGEDGPLVAQLRAAGIDTRVAPLAPGARDVRRDRAAGRDAIAAAAATARYVLRLRRIVRSEGIDVVHTNTLKAALYGGAAGRLARRPVVWHVRDRLTVDYLGPRTARLVRAAARVLPSAVLANSRATAATIARPATVITDPPPTSSSTPDQRHDGVVVGLAGRLAPWKGQDLFLRAFAAAAADRPDVRAAIIGAALFGEDTYAAGLPELAAALGIADRVEFRGFRDDMAAEYAGLDVLVHCSTTAEPYGQVVAEGMAAGRCVLAAAEGGPTELITDGVDGVLVPPRDVAALARALERVIDDPVGRAGLGAAARATAAAWSAETAAAEVVEVYRRLSVRRKPSH